MRRNMDFDTRHHPAALLLMWRNGGAIRLDRSERPYDRFREILQPVLRPEDEKIYPAVQYSGATEPPWHIGLRLALLHMREDKSPTDARVRRLGNGLYEMTDKGRESLRDYLRSADVPLDWLELEVEELEDGSALHHYLHPMDGDDLITFRCSCSSEWPDADMRATF